MRESCIGKVVLGTVERVEEYALFIRYQQDVVVVLIPDVSESPVHLKESWRVGSTTPVRIDSEVVYEAARYKGTIRGVRLPSAQSSVAPDGSPSLAPPGAPSSAPRVNAGIGPAPESDDGDDKKGQ